MAEVRHSSTVNAPQSKVFDYVNDYRTVPEYMMGITRFDLVGEQESGVGAKFDSVMRIGPKDFSSILECTEWVENEKIRMEAQSGFPVIIEWTFAATGESVSEMECVFDFKLPGGLAGRALKAIIDPFAKQAVKHTEKQVRAAVEG